VDVAIDNGDTGRLFRFLGGSTSSGRSDASDRVAGLTETAGGNATTDLSAFHSETKAPGLMKARGYVRATGTTRRGREK